MKVVLDTNVLIAAFIAHGACNELLEHCALHHEIVVSPFILNEFSEKLRGKFKFTARETKEAVRLIKSRSLMVTPQPLPQSVSRDPDDDNVIGTALAGACDCIVTGDKDLLDLDKSCGVAVISPGDFWKYEGG